MRRLLLAVVFSVSGCLCVDPSKVVTRCGADSACPTELTCCPDDMCRASCTPTAGGSAAGGSSMAGGETGGGTVATGGGTAGGGMSGGTAGGIAGCQENTPCTTNQNRCRFGLSHCESGLMSCFDGPAAPDGITCAADKICVRGFCVDCQPDLPCGTNPNPCFEGVTTCGATPGCVDSATARPLGATCGVGRVCSDTQVCFECEHGAACSTNPGAPCVAGVVRCQSGQRVCADGAAAPTGTTCDTSKVCIGGQCVTCAAGQACTTNPAPCKAGVTACGASPACNDGANKPAGTSCGTNQFCDSNGACTGCTEGAPCTTNPDPCHTGVTRCQSGSPVCANDSPRAPGTSCGAGSVCSATAACVMCNEGASCSTNPNADCRNGRVSCATGAAVCVDGTPKTAGTGCGSGQVCDANGFCGMCVAGNSCTSNPGAPCKAGVTSCSTGSTVCLDSTNLPAGTACGPDRVCNAGACVACVANAPCSTNPNSTCKLGIVSCTTGAAVCIDSGNRPAGTVCGMNQVCSPNGNCIACNANQPCTANPSAGCRNGVTSCNSGTLACIDGSNKPAGTTCGTSQVCDANGNCGACVAAAACTTNPGAPCVSGTTDCSSGSAVCTNGMNASAGTSCGVGQVCNGGGACVACNAGATCTTNPNICKQGVISCATGAPVCTDGTANKAPGTICGTNQVCSGTGTCATCNAGASCTTNPNPCFNGVIACGSGAPVCVDGSPKGLGASCGTNLVCNGANSCVSCTAGAVCTGNPGACYNGTTTCNTGAPVCVDGTAKTAGTACSGGVCSAGTCNPCTQGAACTTNPGTVCKNGAISCSSGSAQCLDGTNKANGTTCPGGVCLSGACNACNSGAACTTNPTADCKNGTISCTTGAPVCVDAAAKPNGTTCGGGVCNNGFCSACNAGAACSTNPNAACKNGVVDCTSGSAVCVDGTNKTNGTACSGGVCNAGACNPCSQGTACTTNPDPVCHNGSIECGSGSAVCVNSSNKPNGTSCSGGVCNAGACNPCSAGAACTPSNVCRTGAISCSSGAPVCVENGNMATGSSCPGGVCNTGSCVACTQGAACTGNPTECKTGVIACSTGTPICVDGADQPTTVACLSGSGVCASGACCTGCIRGSTCYPGGTDRANCGLGGVTCDTCPTGTNWRCVAGVCEYIDRCALKAAPSTPQALPICP